MENIEFSEIFLKYLEIKIFSRTAEDLTASAFYRENFDIIKSELLIHRQNPDFVKYEKKTEKNKLHVFKKPRYS